MKKIVVLLCLLLPCFITKANENKRVNNMLEQYLLCWDASDRYLRTETRDADNKRQVSYSYLHGKKLADMTPMGSGTAPIITLYAYDGKWDLKKVIDPNKLETDYKTNLQGLVFEKKNVDQGVTNYFYDEVGNLVVMQDKNLWMQNSGMIRLFTYDHFGRMLLQLKGVVDLAKLCPNCDFNPSGGNGDQFYRPIHPRGYFTTLQSRSRDISYPPSANPLISNTYGHSYFWLPNQNILEEDVEGVHTIFDTIQNPKVEKLWAYNDLQMDYIDATTRTPNQNALYRTKLTEIISKIPAPFKTDIQNKAQKSLGKLSTAGSYDYNGTLHEITATTYNADELPEDEYHYAKFLSFNPKHFLIQYRGYNLAGKVGETELYTYNPTSGGRTSIHAQKMSYDLMGYLSQLKFSLAGAPYITLADYTYDLASGKLKKIMGYQNGTSLTTDYSYDLRERLTKIDNPLFEENIYYDAAYPTSASFTPNYNGNINATRTLFKGSCTPSTISSPLTSEYQYDLANRLKSAQLDASLSGSSPYGSQTYVYQPNGNLSQYASIDLIGGVPTSRSYFYSYLSGTNKVQSVSSTGSGTTTAPYSANNRNFSYDYNGNVKWDNYRDVYSYYDRANLPYQSLKNGVYTYYGYNTADARIYKGTMNQAYYYLGGMGVYDMNANQWEHYPGGMSRIKNGGLQLIVKDHLTNTRAIVSDDPNQCKSLSYESAYDYYPFGKVLRKYEISAARYQSTDHETDEETGYNDRNARWYDDEVLNFMNCDPLSKDYPSWSPYHYVGRNPIKLIDPTGMEVAFADDEALQYHNMYYNKYNKDGSDNPLYNPEYASMYDALHGAKGILFYINPKGSIGKDGKVDFRIDKDNQIARDSKGQAIVDIFFVDGKESFGGTSLHTLMEEMFHSKQLLDELKQGKSNNINDLNRGTITKEVEAKTWVANNFPGYQKDYTFQSNSNSYILPTEMGIMGGQYPSIDKSVYLKYGIEYKTISIENKESNIFNIGRHYSNYPIK